ncbi:MAG: hypothetical protein ABW001_06115 [Mycobacterium sp.]
MPTNHSYSDGVMITVGLAVGVSGLAGAVVSVDVSAVVISGAVMGPGGAGSGSAWLVELNNTASTAAPAAAVPVIAMRNLVRVEFTDDHSFFSDSLVVSQPIGRLPRAPSLPDRAAHRNPSLVAVSDGIELYLGVR